MAVMETSLNVVFKHNKVTASNLQKANADPQLTDPRDHFLAKRSLEAEQIC